MTLSTTWYSKPLHCLDHCPADADTSNLTADPSTSGLPHGPTSEWPNSLSLRVRGPGAWISKGLDSSGRADAIWQPIQFRVAALQPHGSAAGVDTDTAAGASASLGDLPSEGDLFGFIMSYANESTGMSGAKEDIFGRVGCIRYPGLEHRPKRRFTRIALGTCILRRLLDAESECWS